VVLKENLPSQNLCVVSYVVMLGIELDTSIQLICESTKVVSLCSKF